MHNHMYWCEQSRDPYRYSSAVNRDAAVATKYILICCQGCGLLCAVPHLHR